MENSLLLKKYYDNGTMEHVGIVHAILIPLIEYLEPFKIKIEFRQMPPPNSMGIYLVGENITPEIEDYARDFVKPFDF